MPTVLGLNTGPALFAPPIEIARAIPCAAQSDLEHFVILQQSVFPCAAKRAPMRDGFAKHIHVCVRMRVHMDQRDRPMFFGHRPQNGPGQCVIAPQCQGNGVMGQNIIIKRRDNIDRFFQIKQIDRHVPNISHLHMIKGGRPCRHVIGADHPAFVADLTRAQTCAGAVRRTNVHRYTHKTGIQPRSRVRTGQAHHRCRAASAGHFVAAQGLIVIRHDAYPCIDWGMSFAPTLRKTDPRLKQKLGAQIACQRRSFASA